MFALKPWTEIAIRTLMIAAFVFEALAPTTAIAMSDAQPNALAAVHGGVKAEKIGLREIVSRQGCCAETSAERGVFQADVLAPTPIDTASPTETAFATETITDTPTPPSEPSPTPTAPIESTPTTILETPTPSATLDGASTPSNISSPAQPSSLSAALPSLSLEFAATPEQAKAGDRVTFTLKIANTGQTPVTGLSFSDFLPAGFDDPQSDMKGFTFDAQTREWIWKADASDPTTQLLPAGNFVLRYNVLIQSEITNAEIVDTGSVGADGLIRPLLAEATLTLVEAQSSLTPLDTTGGEALGLNGRVKVTFPENSLGTPASVLIQQIPTDTQGEPWLSFELGLLVPQPENAQPLPPVGRIDNPTSAPLGVENDRTIPFKPMEAKFDLPVQLTVSLTGLADLSALPADKTPFLVTLDEDSGAWVKMPLKSVDPDANTISAEIPHFSTWGVGIGNSFPQNGAGVLLFDQPYNNLFTGHSQYSIPIWTPAGRNGMAPSVSLSYSSATADGVLGDVQASWVGMGWNVDSVEIARKITNGVCNPCGNGTTWGYENKFLLLFNGSGYLLIPDGTTPGRYHTKSESFLYVQLHNDSLGNNSPAAQNTSGEWWEVVQKDGTRWRLGWDDNSNPTSSHAEQLAAMAGYPGAATGAWATLGYAGHASNVVASRWRADQVTDLYGNQMTFSYFEESRVVNGTSANYDRASYLDTITYTKHTLGTPAAGYSVVFVRESRAGSEVPMPQYDWDNWDTYRLNHIDIKHGSTIVRTYSMTYVVRPYTDSGVTWQTTVLDSVAVSGGGANMPTIRFDYADQPNRAACGTGCLVWAYPRLASVANGWGGSATFAYENDVRPGTSWYNWRVTTLDIADSVSSTMETTYAYGNACYKVTNPPDDWTCNTTNPGELVGYDQATATTKNFVGGANLAIAVHKFYTDLQKAGLEYEVQNQDAAGTTTLSKTSTTFTTATTGFPTGGYFTYASAVDQYLYTTSLVRVSHTEYTYDTTTGNLTLEKEYNGTPTLYRQTAYEYVTNTSPAVWILNTVSKRKLKDSGGTILSEQHYGYDGSLPGSGSPTIGKLTLSRQVNGTQTVDTTYVYDPYGNVTEERLYKSYGSTSSQPSGTYLSYFTAYDAALQTYVTSTTPPLLPATTIIYDYGLGVPLTVTDPNTQTTTSAYDGLGRVTSVTYPGSAQQNIKYTYPTLPVSAPFAVKIEIWDDSVVPAVYRSAWQIQDGLGRAIQTQGPSDTAGVLTLEDTSYNAQGLVSNSGLPRTSSATGGTYSPPTWSSVAHTISNYDALGRITSVAYPDSTSETFSYSGLRTTSIDRKSHKKVQENDAFRRLIKVEEYTGSSSYTLYATTTYGYNVRDQLNAVTDAASNPTTITYNQYGRKTGMTDPDMGTWSYAYDTLGNLTRQTDARGQRVCLYYDSLNRLLGKHYRSDDACPTSPTYNITYGYDVGTNGKGHRTSMTDASGSASWTYDGRGRMITESKIITGASTFNTSWAYSSADQLTSMTYPGGEVVNYSYNNRMLLNSVIGSSTYVSSTAYDAAGRITQRNYGNTTQTTYTYFPWTTQGGRLQTLQSGTSGSPASLQNLTYTYDSVGNILTIADALAGPQTQTFGYDDLNRLTSGDVAGGSVGIYHQNYTYAANGNMLSIGSQTNTYNTVHKHAVASQTSGDHFQYDANGNMTQRVIGADTYDLAYDAENHLTQVKQNGVVTATITYDGDGKRVVSWTSGNATVRFIGNYYEYRSATDITKYYFAGSQRVAMNDNGTRSYLLGDHLGSTAITTDASGVLTSELRYRAFGDTRYTNGTIPTRFRFTGQRSYTPDFGLIFYGSRWYDPTLGRFTQPDTMVPNPSNPQDLNRYSYVTNNPLRYTDPTGHRCVSAGPGDCLTSTGTQINGAGGLTTTTSTTTNHTNNNTSGSGGTSTTTSAPPLPSTTPAPIPTPTPTPTPIPTPTPTPTPIVTAPITPLPTMTSTGTAPSSFTQGSSEPNPVVAIVGAAFLVLLGIDDIAIVGGMVLAAPTVIAAPIIGGLGELGLLVLELASLNVTVVAAEMAGTGSMDVDPLPLVHVFDPNFMPYQP